MPASHRSSGSFSGSANTPPKEARVSIDSERSFDVGTPHVLQNGGHERDQPNGGDDDGDDPVNKLQRELDRTKEEKETLAAQYRNLLAKLTQMRTSLGNKLQQDAVREHINVYDAIPTDLTLR